MAAVISHFLWRPSRRTAVVGAAGLTLVVSLLAGCSNDTSAGDGTTTTSKVTTTTSLVGVLTPVEQLTTGQCFDELPESEQQPFAVMIIDCKDPHTFEAYASAKLAISKSTKVGAAYPGELPVANAAEAQCFELFPAFVGVEWEVSDYDIQTWWPSNASWKNDNDRAVVCAVYRVTGGRTTGSVRGAQE